MRRLPLCLMLLVGLALPAGLVAQDADAPPILRLSFYQCDLSSIGPVMEQVEALEMPIWNELVDEGMIDSYGHFIHAWADEWNVGIYTVAETIDDIVQAAAEAGARMQERHPDADGGLNAACPAHRDNFYVMGPSTDDDDGGDN
ncbi:MAG: hypothetical protein R3266_02835 [Gemmatimonadota bacterium]|nr:hypothetical protein [Gemmatimonadota bacterium]